MTASLSGQFTVQALEDGGAPLVGGRLYTYVNGTTTLKTAYTDKAGTIPHTYTSDGLGGQYIALNARGEIPDNLYFRTGSADITLKTSAGATVWTRRADPQDDADSGLLRADLALTDSGKGTALLGSNDAGGYYAGTTAETQLQELGFLAGNLIGKGAASDLGAALTAFASAWPSGQIANLGRRTWTLTSGYTYTGQRMHIRGTGKNLSMVSFDPAGTATALKFDAGGGGGYNEGTVSGLGFISTNSATKTALEFVNAANCEVSAVAIATGNWLGDSIGLKASGRQLLRVYDCKFACARPIVYSQNSYFTSLNVDHFLIENSELVGTSATRPVVEFSDGVSFSTTTIRNTAIVQGQDGIAWVDTTSTAASFGVMIQNVRTEQGLDGAAWSVRLESTAQDLQTVVLDNVRFDSTRNGLKLRRALHVTLRNCDFAMSSAKTSIDMTFVAGSRLVIENCRFQANKVLTLTNARLVKTEKATTGLITAEYVFDSGPAANMLQFGVPIGGQDISIATTATATICDQNFSGFIFVVHSGRVSAIYACTGSSLTTLEIADPSGRYSITSGTVNSNNIYYSGNNLTIENRDPAAATLTYNVILLGRSLA